jgi:osmotically-inducible protein OsmY
VTMNRSSAWVAWADVAAAFTLGASLACLVAAGIERARRVMPTAVSDDTVRDRVRARVSELVSRPDAIEVTVEEGIVRLSGDVLAQERDVLLHGLTTLPGVWRVRNALGTLQAEI